MFTLRISDDDGFITARTAKSYTISPSDDGESLYLRINTDEGIVGYHIHTDERTGGIDEITEYLLDQLDSASLGRSIFDLREYLERDYIYVGEGETCRQFTAQKL